MEGIRSVEVLDAARQSSCRPAVASSLAATQYTAPNPYLHPSPDQASADSEPALPFRCGLGSVFARASVPLAFADHNPTPGHAGSNRLPPRSPSVELAATRASGGFQLERAPSGRPPPKAERQDTPAVRPGVAGQWGQRPAAEVPMMQPTSTGMQRQGSLDGIGGMPFRRGLEHVRLLLMRPSPAVLPNLFRPPFVSSTALCGESQTTTLTPFAI